MAELMGAPLEKLLESMWEEWQHHRTIFGYPERKIFRGFPGFDFSVTFHGKRAATPLGPASGPHTQLAQNIVLAFLGGARIMELKTIQIKDQLQIPRPCIDVRNIGFNVEWSQELRLEDSLNEYLKAWILIHALREWEILGIPRNAPFYDVIFDVSVGYDLEGISSPVIHQWLQRIQNAEEDLEEMLDALSDRWHSLKKMDLPVTVATSVTLSTFHGCPRDEIENIVQYLIAEHGFHVMVKFNPTILGYTTVKDLLHNRLGYQHIELDPQAFETDLALEDALAMMKRLQAFARQYHREVGAKFTNTLVVKNHDRIFQEPVMYLSGTPLHVIAMQAMLRFREELGPRFPVSFSAGIQKFNVADAVRCHMIPITVCTDLLKTGGYTRFFDYLKHLRDAMAAAGASSIPEFIIRTSGGEIQNVAEAGLQNARKLVPNLIHDPRYHYPANRKTPPRVDRQLRLLDCISCNKCLPVCPNAANFTIPSTPIEKPVPEIHIQNGQMISKPSGAVFRVEKTHQIANLADWCNECGNCDTYCPEEGAPYRIKPRFFFNRHSYEKFSSYDGFFFPEPNVLVGRLNGKEYRFAFLSQQNQFSWTEDGVTVILDQNDRPVGIEGRVTTPRTITLTPFFLFRTLWEGFQKIPHHYAARVLVPNPEPPGEAEKSD